MVTETKADEFRILVSTRLWFQHKRSVMQRAAVAARKAGLRADGDPDEEHVVLVWKQHDS